MVICVIFSCMKNGFSITGKKVSEKGLVKRVVKDLVEPFDGSNHVLYCDNYYSSGPLVEELARKKI